MIIMSSQPVVATRQGAARPVGPTSNRELTDRGEEEGSSGPKLEHAEVMNKELKRHGEAHNVSLGQQGEGHR